MQLTELSLWNFRNYGRLHLELEGDLFLLVGANAQGKTNLLEAIGLLVTGRSPRTSRHRDLVRWGETHGGVRARARRRHSSVEVEVRLQVDGPRTLLVHGKPVSRTSQLLGQLHAVFFFPDDLQMVKGSPALRRRFLDLQLSQVNRAYRERLVAYQRILRQRNALLAQGLSGRETAARLSPWDQQLAEVGGRLMAQRAQAVAALSRRAQEVHQQISGGRERLILTYRPFWATAAEGGEGAGAGEEALGPDAGAEPPADPEWWSERLEEEIQRRRGEEIYRRSTLVGPQRDDLDIWIDGRPARSFASQGQQRTVVLACKMAEVEYICEQTGEAPLLLLDDVFSELDERRRTQLLETVGSQGQTFVTSTTPDVYGHWRGLKACLFEIHQGTLTRRDWP